jgi:hypothetical protein
VRRFYVSRTTHFVRKTEAKAAVIRAIRAARRSAPSPGQAVPALSPAPTLQPTLVPKLVVAPSSPISQFEADLAIAEDMHPETIYIAPSVPIVDALVL